MSSRFSRVSMRYPLGSPEPLPSARNLLRHGPPEFRQPGSRLSRELSGLRSPAQRDRRRQAGRSRGRRRAAMRSPARASARALRGSLPERCSLLMNAPSTPDAMAHSSARPVGSGLAAKRAQASPARAVVRPERPMRPPRPKSRNPIELATTCRAMATPADTARITAGFISSLL